MPLNPPNSALDHLPPVLELAARVQLISCSMRFHRITESSAKLKHSSAMALVDKHKVKRQRLDRICEGVEKTLEIKHIGRSQSWDAAGWDEDSWENDATFECQRPPGRRNSLTYGGEGFWCEQPSCKPHDIILQGGTDLKQDLYRYPEPHFTESSFWRGSIPDFTYYNRQPAMSTRSSLPPQDYYNDPSLATRSPRDSCYYRDHMTNRPLLNYGMPGGRLAWDQMQVRSPVPHEGSHVYRDPVIKMVPEAQRIRNRDPSLTRYGVEPPTSRCRGEPSVFPYRQAYNDVVERSVDSAGSKQIAPTCLVVDPNSAAAPDGNVMLPATSVNRGHGPVRDNFSTKVPYDGYEATMTPSQMQMPASFPGQDIKRNVDPEYLAMMRSEGISESTLNALLQQGFDSPGLLAMMEDNDIKSVAPNLGQARMLSRIVHTYKVEMQLQRQSRKNTAIRSRNRSNSFSHRSELLQNEYGTHPFTNPVVDGIAAYQSPTASMQPPSPRIAELTRRPSSAPTQHLLETATGFSPQVTPFLPSSGYSALGPCNMHLRQATGYSVPSAIPMNTLQTNPHANSKIAYSTTYTVPMELMKRNPLSSPAHSPHISPQVLRKQGVQVEPNLAPVGPSFPGHHSPCQKSTRRTGPPVIVSTMTSPEPKNSLAKISLCLGCILYTSRGDGKLVIPKNYMIFKYNEEQLSLQLLLLESSEQLVKWIAKFAVKLMEIRTKLVQQSVKLVIPKNYMIFKYNEEQLSLQLLLLESSEQTFRGLAQSCCCGVELSEAEASFHVQGTMLLFLRLLLWSL
ncbi:hypothetical protein E2320_008518 [Naja naja]|nr:hypothetical protein E2320_008518 [Naja naja]